MDEKNEINKEKTCFVITPIGSEDSPVRRHIDGVINEALLPVVDDKYDIKVSHRIPNIGSINKQILRLIYESELVIANLTNLNPNVMYELAFRHSTGKPVITIAEKGTIIPFDVIDTRTIFYDNDPQGMIELRENLIQFIKENDLSRTDYGPIVDTFKIDGYKYFIEDLISKPVASAELNDFFAQVLEKLDKIKSSDFKVVKESNILKIDESHISKIDMTFNDMLSRSRSLSMYSPITYFETVFNLIEKNRFLVSNMILTDELKTKYITMVNESYINYIDAKQRIKISD